MCDVGGGASVGRIPGRIPGTRASNLSQQHCPAGPPEAHFFYDAINFKAIFSLIIASGMAIQAIFFSMVHFQLQP